MPVVVSGVAVDSGDIVVGDRDGVVVVPLRLAQTVLGKLEDVRRAEANLEAKVKAGLEIPDFISSILESDRVEEVD